MPNKKFAELAPQEDTAVAWARRRETIRGALKLFRVLLDAVRRHAEWAEARHGVGGAQLWVLWELGQTPGMRAVDLAKNMAIHRKTVETLLHGLLDKGLIRTEIASDVQSPAHFLTIHGQCIVDASPEYGQGVLKAALERLPDPLLAQTVDSLRGLSENLPFREDRAALKPLADILWANSQDQARYAAHRQDNLES
jgi:DNA-binding MarR family transcriptional regulator